MDNFITCNRPIKVVPTLEESLNTLGLNVELDINTTTWFEQLKTTWKTWKKSPTVDHHFKLFFETSPDPYRIVLVFVIKCKEFKDSKPKTLPFYIMETLQKWSLNTGTAPDDFLKLPAFQIATEQRNQHFLNLVIKTYRVNTIKETIVPIVKEMIKNDNSKQASQVIIAMELFDDIPVEDLLFPLILQDKPNMIDEYLSECPDQVTHLVQFLDKLLDKNFSTRNYVQKYIDKYKISHVKYDKIHYRPLGKLVARLCNKFNIPIETCKNLSKNRTIGGLRYLIHQKYVDHNISMTVWEDLVKDSLKQNTESATEFIYMLMEYDSNEAAKWVQHLNLPETMLPHSLHNMSLCQGASSENESWDTDDNYYKFTLPSDRIVIIDTIEKFYVLTSEYLKNCNVVSIDCEWKPSFGATQSQVALVQIAVDDYVYLIDTLVLNKQEYSSFWFTLNKILLDNAEIIKLGFGLEQDLKEMKASIIGLGNIKVKGEGLLDLSILWKNLVSSGLILQSDNSNGGHSLSSLVQLCFGLPLQKSEQCSNWEIRPLRDTQLHYAALDAHVLLELYNCFRKQCLEQGLNFDDICNDVMLDSKTKCTRKLKIFEKNNYSPHPQAKKAEEVKFFVDIKLMELIPYLRYFGIDTVVTPTTMLWHDIINLAISEERYIVVSKFKTTPTKNFPQSSILQVEKRYSIQEQLGKIKSYFNLIVNSMNIRCISCNNLDLKKLPMQDVVELCSKYTLTSKMVNHLNVNEYDEDTTDYDKFLSDYDDSIIYEPVLNPVKNNECITSKDVPLEISNVQKLIQSPQEAIICESCGRLFWEGDELYKAVISVIT